MHLEADNNNLDKLMLPSARHKNQTLVVTFIWNYITVLLLIEKNKKHREHPYVTEICLHSPHTLLFWRQITKELNKTTQLNVHKSHNTLSFFFLQDRNEQCYITWLEYQGGPWNELRWSCHQHLVSCRNLEVSSLYHHCLLVEDI